MDPPQSSDVVASVPEFEAEVVQSVPASIEVQNEATEQDPVFQVLHAHHTLPPEFWEAFGQSIAVLANAINATIPTAVQEGPGPGIVAFGDLKTCPSCTLWDTKDSRRRHKRLNEHCGKFLGGGKLQVPDMSRMPGKQKRAYKRRWNWVLAARLQKQLERGNIKRAAQCVDQAELAEPTLETMQKLAQLHPQADPRQRWTCPTQCQGR